MPRSGSGTFSTLGGTLAIPGTTIAATPYNNNTTDVANALTDSLSRSGLGGMQANLLFQGFKGVGAAPGTSTGDVVTYEQISTGLGFSAEATVASAATTPALDALTPFVNITGTTTITSLGTGANRLRYLRFSGVLTLTYNATSLITPGAVDFLTAPGDVMIVESDSSSNVRVINYQRAAQTTQTALASAATTDLGTIPSQTVNITGTTTITSFGSTASLANPFYDLTFAGALLLTYNATSLQIPGAINITTAAGDSARARYLGSGNWKLISYTRSQSPISAAQPTSRSFKNLVIQATSNTNVALTADEVVIEQAGGVTYRATAVSLPTIVTNASGLNGLDTGTAAISTWYYVYVIFNPTTSVVGGLLSASATSPTLPSGFTFFETFGVVRNDVNGNLWRSIQSGRTYQIVIGTNPATAQVATSGNVGTFSVTSPTLSTVSLSAFVPPIACAVYLAAYNSWKGGTSANMLVAPSTAWGGTNNGPEGSNGNVFPFRAVSSTNYSVSFRMSLEAQSFAVANTATGTSGAAVAVLGFEVNL